MGGSFAVASAQSSLRKAVYGETSSAPAKKTAPRKKVESSKKTTVKASTSARKPTGGGPKRTTKPKTTTRPGWINVLFESKEPNTQILINGNSVGATDQSGMFQRAMTPGSYRVSAVHNSKVIFSEQAVQIRIDGAKVKLFDLIAASVPEKKEVPLVIPKTQAEIEIERAREISASVVRVFTDFLDPQKSATVTTDDWRFVSNAAVLGEFQNLSKQQIEAQRRFAAGQVELAEGNAQKAFASFRAASQSFQGSPLPFIGLGDAYVASAQWQDARRSYEQARAVGPNLWIVHRRLADVYRILGERKKASTSYTDAIKFGDTRYETRFLRVRSIVDAGNAEEAIPMLEELLKEQPRAELHLSLGEAFEMLKRDVAALDHYRKAVELDPNSPVAQYRLARVYYEQREFEKAVEGFDAALKLDGEKKSFSHDEAKEKRSNASSRIRPTTR